MNTLDFKTKTHYVLINTRDFIFKYQLIPGINLHKVSYYSFNVTNVPYVQILIKGIVFYSDILFKRETNQMKSNIKESIK